MAPLVLRGAAYAGRAAPPQQPLRQEALPRAASRRWVGEAPRGQCVRLFGVDLELGDGRGGVGALAQADDHGVGDARCGTNELCPTLTLMRKVVTGTMCFTECTRETTGV